MDLTNVLKQLREELDAASVRILALERREAVQRRAHNAIADAVPVDAPKPRTCQLVVIKAVAKGSAARLLNR
jgi:hypothetical protein